MGRVAILLLAGFLLLPSMARADEKLDACEAERITATVLAARLSQSRSQAEIEWAKTEARLRTLVQEIEALKAKLAEKGTK